MESFFLLFICFLFFAIGDTLGVFSKAKLSSVFVALILFLICFMTGLIPPDIIEQARLSQLGGWASAYMIFHMGTSINLGELKREWKTVLVAVISMVVAIVGLLFTIPIIGKEAAFVAIPVINGGIVATQIMTESALNLGFPLAAALGTIIYATEKFLGTPPASFSGLKEAENILKEYRQDKEGYLKKIGKSAEQLAEEKPGFADKHKKYFTDFTCLAITGFFAYLSYVLQDLTGGVISYSIWSLILGATIGHFKLVPKNILTKAKSSGLLSVALFASIIPSLATIKLGDLIGLSGQTLLVYGVTFASIYIVMFLTPVWKLVGSKNLAVGIAMAQLLGFPATYLIANEVATAAAKTEDEKEVVLNKIMPAYVVAGFASVTSISIIIAGIFVNMM
jgi:hypothetical protein